MKRLIRTSRSVFLRTITYVSLVLFVVLGTISFAYLNQKVAQAASNNVVNFQARILQANGAVVADGTYNVEFKIYDAASGGTNLWTESRLTTDAANLRVITKNGYVSAALGEKTAFPGTINWSQKLYLTINIGGTGGSPSWDGEMDPRMLITAVPHAMSAEKLQVDNGTYNSSLEFTNPTVGSQTFDLPDLAAATSATIITTGNLASITGVGTVASGTWQGNAIAVGYGGTGAATFTQYGVLYGNGTSALGVTAVGTTGQCLISGNGTGAPTWGDCASGTAGNYIQNQNASQQATSNFWISGTGRADTSFATILLDTPTVAALDIGTTNATQINLNKLTVVKGATADDTAAALNVTDSADDSLLYVRNDGNVGIGITNPSGILHVKGALPSLGGQLVIDSTTLTEQVGLTFAQNGTQRWQLYVPPSSTDFYLYNGNAASIPLKIMSTATTDSLVLSGGNVGIGTSNPTGQLHISKTYNPVDSTDQYGLYHSPTIAPNAANNNIYYVDFLNTNYSPTTSNPSSSVYNSINIIKANAATTNSVALLRASQDEVRALSGDNTTISSAQAQRLTVNIQSGANTNIIDAYGTYADIINAGNGYIRNATGVRIGAVQATGTDAGQTHNAYGLHIENTITASGGTTNNVYSIYNASTANSYFAGNLGIGDTSPAALLTVGDGDLFQVNSSGAIAAVTGITSTGNINGAVTSATAFRVQSAAAAETVFTVDTSGNQVKVGNDTGTGASTTLLVLDSANTSTGLSAVNGAMYYDTVIGRVMCREAGTWNPCGSKSSLQDSYNSSIGGTTPEILVDGTTRFGVDIQDANTPVGGTVALFAIRGSATASTLGASLFQVSNNSDAPLVAIGLGTQAPTTGIDLQFGGSANRTIQVLQNTSAGNGRSLTVKAGEALTSGLGGQLNLYGGDAAGSNQNGGNVYLTGGTPTGTGVRGLVVIDTPTYTTAARQDCAVDCTITQANVDTTGAVIANATTASLTISLPDPTNTTAGRIVYVTAYGTSNDFSLSVNGGGVGNLISMRANTTATMIWSGSDWTAAGASSSTTLQAAYDNTLTSAGGAEIILNNSASSNGLTVRNGSTSPIIGGALFEVQSSIGSNLLSVNNNAVEYSSNGGAETIGASASTFPANTWTAAPSGGTVSRYTTQGNYIATGTASASVVTTASNHGAANTLASTLTPNLKYTVSYAVRGTTSFTTLDTIYSRDGTNTSTTDCATGSTATTGIWTRISCTFTVPSSGVTSSNAIFIRQSDSTGRTFYIDNLSVTVSADVNHATDGGVDDAGNFATNWIAYGTGTSVARETSIIYDTSASARADVPANTFRGIRNKLAISPQINTQYLVTLYARSTVAMTDFSISYTRDAGTNVVFCTDYNTQSVGTAGWSKITCLFTTDGTAATNPYLTMYQATTGTARSIYVDALSITLNSNTSSNVQIGGGSDGGPTTLLTLDRSSGPPIAANNESYLGSMYYDTTTGKIQCYESDGWGACGSAPDNIVNLNPEFAGAVLNGGATPGVGVMTADFCGNGGNLSVNTSLCASGEARNFYKWTSPQATQQTYSIYVTYQLPASFKAFADDNTVQLTARRSSSDAAVTYEMSRSEGGTISQCGTSETTVTTSDNTWQTVGINGNESTGCGFTTSSANAFVIFKINVKAQNNANAYVGTLTFTTTGR